MGLFKEACRYLFKKFPVFLLVMGLPAIAAAFTANPFNALVFLAKYPALTPNGIGDVFDAMFGELLWWKVVLQFVSITAGVSILVSVVERNLKTGRYGLRHPLKRMNDSVKAVLPLLLIYALLLIISYYILGGFVSLMHGLISGFGNAPGVFNLILTSIVIIGYFALTTQIIKGTLLLTPCNLITGYTLTESLSYGIKLSQNKGFEFYFACFIACVAGYVITFAAYLLKIPAFITTGLVNFFIVSYLVSLMMTAYFDLTNSERYD